MKFSTEEIKRLRSELQTSNDCHISEVNRLTKERDELKDDIIHMKEVEKHYLKLITLPL